MITEVNYSTFLSILQDISHLLRIIQLCIHSFIQYFFISRCSIDTVGSSNMCLNHKSFVEHCSFKISTFDQDTQASS